MRSRDNKKKISPYSPRDVQNLPTKANTKLTPSQIFDNFNTLIEEIDTVVKEEVIFKKLLQTVSHPLDSTEEEISEQQDNPTPFIEEIDIAEEQNEAINKSFASYLLIKISNSFLTLQKVKAKYKLIKDPLAFKINKLEKEQKILALAQESIPNKPTQGQEEDLAQYMNASHITNEQELKILKKLVNDREKLYPDFKASFPFIPLKLSPTFVESYNTYFNSKKNEQEIQQELLKIRKILTNKKEDDASIPLDKLYSFFGVNTSIDIIKVKDEIQRDIEALEQNLQGFPKKKLEKWSTCNKKGEKEKGYFVNNKFTLIPTNNQNKHNKKVVKDLKKEAIKQLKALIVAIDKTKILPDKVKTTSKEIKQLKSDTKDKLLEEIEFIIGKHPNDKEKIIEYLRLTDKAAYKNHNIDSEIIKDTQSNLLKLSNNSGQISRLYDNLKNTKLYITDSEYLKEVAKQEFLIKVLAYRKINRDKAKSILIEIENKERAVVPPGLNSTVDILHQGSMSHLVGELGSYKHIGQLYNKTLENFSDYFQSRYGQNSKEIDSHITPYEREEEFESLFLIEIMRNSAALLTNPMFFELAKANYAPLRVIGDYEVKQAESVLKEIEKKYQKKIKSNPNPYQKALNEAKAKYDELSTQQKEQSYTKKYELSLIHEQMPMAMKEAVTAAIYLENSFKNFLNKRLYYDYRNIIDNEKGATVLAQRDNNILFDWICFKLGITRDTLKTSIPNQASTGQYYYNYKKSSPEFALTVSRISLETVLVIEIKKFPLKLFNELAKSWYGKDILSAEMENSICPISLLSEKPLVRVTKNGSLVTEHLYNTNDIDLWGEAVHKKLGFFRDNSSYQITGNRNLKCTNTYLLNAKLLNDLNVKLLNDDIQNLKEDINKILSKKDSELQITSPVRLQESKYWVSATLIAKKDGEKEVQILDSLYEDKVVSDDIISTLKEIYDQIILDLDSTPE